MESVADVLAAMGGSARTHELNLHFTKRQLALAVASGEVARSVRGVYALARLNGAEHAALELSAALYLRSAALAHGLGVLHRPRTIALAVPRGRRSRRLAGTTTYRRLLPAEDLVGRGQVRATSPVRTVLDCAAMLPFAEGLAVADSALRMQAASRAELEAAAVTWVGRNKAAQRRVLKYMDGRAANAFESGLRAACLEAGVEMEPQAVIHTAGGDYRVDLAHQVEVEAVQVEVVAEADSYEWHGGREDLHRDCTRYNELVRAGRVVLRFSWEHVMHEREWIGEVVSDVVRRAVRHNSGWNERRMLRLTA
ncbi:type IV toxin-antitoxin system AbiEi family antitoxin [Sinomonas sp. ASV486]|uniref:type IV toxin-antitoxin system AbiEi family antitoxin n=1 Tax=Sinomonas sp. ASV486 TaxID=3051170 RepID=UPI0027DAC90D|nr:type IV toxin-antitoxin system AbiEi family antitoxin [Sinomonas sp. ASV486]MDQ4488880.1 type IV toxin-antitoxin system AbiEi family antitoxin [Sinomonas sp. ASV486]